MRYAHNAKIFRGQLEVAPFAGVFFLLLIFLLVQSTMVFTPGIPIQLPETADLPGVDRPTVAVALDADGLLYFENQILEADALRQAFREKVQRSPVPLTLVIQADRLVRYERLIDLAVLAKESGISEALLATRAAPMPQPAGATP